MATANPVAIAGPPARSQLQRDVALAKANRIREHRAVVKRELAAGQLRLEAALLDVDCATMKVREMLLAFPRLGPIKVGRILDRVGISHGKRAGGLTARQRRELLQAVSGSDELEPAQLAWRPPAPVEVDQAPECETSIAALLA